MGEVEEVRRKMKMGQKNNKEKIEAERLSVSFVAERERGKTDEKEKDDDDGRNKVIYQKNLNAAHNRTLVFF